MVPGIQQRHLTARDGTRIGYQVLGEGPCVVLANGLGGTYVAFRHLYQALAGYKTICWDYRGLYTSGPSSDPLANTIIHQVDDLMEILAAEGVDEFVIAGWSMGVQVSFETIRRHPERVKGMFAINGTYGRTFQTLMGSKFVARTMPSILRLIRAQAPLAGLVTKRAIGFADHLIAIMKRLGLVAPTIDVEVFRAVASGFERVDWVIYSDLLTRLDEHDAEEVLAAIGIPVTIITGDKDIITPPSTAEHMHRMIPQSRLVVIKGGTHYTPVEFPGVITDELGRWLHKIPGWGAPP